MYLTPDFKREKEMRKTMKKLTQGATRLAAAFSIEGGA